MLVVLSCYPIQNQTLDSHEKLVDPHYGKLLLQWQWQTENKVKRKKKWQCFKHPPAIFSLKPYAGGGYAGYDGLANPDCPWLGFTAIPKSPGTPGANAVGGGKGWTPAPGTWPSSVLGPGTFVPKATGNAGCPGRGGWDAPTTTGVYSVFSVVISALDQEQIPSGAQGYEITSEKDKIQRRTTNMLLDR